MPGQVPGMPAGLLSGQLLPPQARGLMPSRPGGPQTFSTNPPRGLATPAQNRPPPGFGGFNWPYVDKGKYGIVPPGKGNPFGGPASPYFPQQAVDVWNATTAGMGSSPQINPATLAGALMPISGPAEMGRQSIGAMVSMFGPEILQQYGPLETPYTPPPPPVTVAQPLPAGQSPAIKPLQGLLNYPNPYHGYNRYIPPRPFLL